MATATLCLEILRKLILKKHKTLILCNKTKKTKTKQELTSSNFSVADFTSASSFSFLKNKEKIIIKKSLQYYFYLNSWRNIWSLIELQVKLYSVLTRILPWGVPGPPLLRNRGPVRTLGGQSYKKHAVRRTWARSPNCLLHEVPTWSNMAEEVFTIRRRSLPCSGTCVGPMKVKATKLKTLTHLISCFFINLFK